MDIFQNIDNNCLTQLLDCLQAVKKTYKKGEIIFDINDEIKSVACVETGEVQILKDDYYKNKIIIATIKEGETFAQAMVLSGQKYSNVCAKATQDTKILFLDFKRIINTCSNSCQFHRQLLENIIKQSAKKNLILQKKIELLSQNTLREKILYFLYDEKKKSKTDFIKIPYNREEMANYLCSDRSSLSRELAKMKKEKIIDFHKNTFRLFDLTTAPNK